MKVRALMLGALVAAVIGLPPVVVAWVGGPGSTRPAIELDELDPDDRGGAIPVRPGPIEAGSSTTTDPTSVGTSPEGGASVPEQPPATVGDDEDTDAGEADDGDGVPVRTTTTATTASTSAADDDDDSDDTDDDDGDDTDDDDDDSDSDSDSDDDDDD